MNDPFASLDPIQKPKTAAERVLTTPAYSQPPAAPAAVAPFGAGAPGSHHMHMGMGMGMGMAPGAPPAMGPSGMGMMNMNGMGGMNPGMGMNNMGMNSMGMNNMGMNNMGMNSMGMGQQPPHNPFQQHSQQQQQEPVMYDNIKNLLQQKPKTPAAFEDSASMDFLENLGSGGSIKTNSGSSASFPGTMSPQVRAAEPTSMAAVSDPFGGGFSSSPTSPSMGSGDIGLGIFETGGSVGGSTSNSESPAANAGGAKSSALAARLANGRRKTQEMQRSQLQLNATSFTQPGSAAGPKISLKEMVGQAPSKLKTTEMSLEEFSSGRSAANGGGGDFGSAEDDPFGMGFGSAGATTRTGSSSAVRQSSFEATSSRAEDTESRPVDDHDSTLW